MENGFLRKPLTTRSRFLAQTLRGSHLATNFPVSCARKAITSYPQPNNPLYAHFPLRQFRFFHLRLGLTSGLPTHISSSNLCTDFSPPSMPHVPPISFSLFDHPCVSGEEYKPRSPYMYICFRPIVISSLLEQNIPLRTLLFNTLSLCSSLYVI
jgi:hypothetical protein